MHAACCCLEALREDLPHLFTPLQLTAATAAAKLRAPSPLPFNVVISPQQGFLAQRMFAGNKFST